MADTNQSSAGSKSKVVIENVRVFDGNALGDLTTIVIDGNVIGSDPEGATERIDAQGGTLLPGLIDSHTHPGTMDDIQSLTKYGVTTAFMLASYGPRNTMTFHGHEGLVDIHYASIPAAAPGSIHGNLVKRFNTAEGLQVQGPEDASRWINDQIAWEPEFIKLVAQTPGMAQETLDNLVKEGHSHGKKVACHAADLASHRQAMLAKVDQIHHMPCDEPADKDLASHIQQQGQICCPTLSIMKAMAEGAGPPATKPRSYPASRDSVRTYHAAGIPILAGTDANNAIAAVPFGKSLHDEFELMVEAGMSPIEVLRSATMLPAKHWDMEDRGFVAPGKRADLVLVDGDPTVDIEATRNLRKVWVAGREYKEDLGTFA